MRTNRIKSNKIIIIFVAIIIIAVGFRSMNTEKNILPKYDLLEIKEMEKEVKYLQNENMLSFSFITDVHINNEKNSNNNLIAFSKITSKDFIKFGVVGGDLYSAYTTSKQQGIEYLSYVYDFFQKNIKKSVYFRKGNHDCNAKLEKSQYITNEDYYNIINKNRCDEVVTNSDCEYSNYYYKDFEENKIRICILNSFEGEGQEFIFNNTELDFIANNMLNFENKQNPEEWQVLFISHTADVSDTDKFNKIINAYQNGEKVSINNKIVDYSKQGKGSVIAFISGHKHIDSYNYDNGYLNIVVQRGFNIPDECNTENELCFSIFTIDYKEHVIYENRCGRGENRQWNYNAYENEWLNEAA